MAVFNNSIGVYIVFKVHCGRSTLCIVDVKCCSKGYGYAIYAG